MKALNNLKIDLNQAKILDVGCGYGRQLRFFMELGALPENLFGVDLMAYRIERAKLLAPNISYESGNAESLSYKDEMFDIITQFVVFSSILDQKTRQGVASEMCRVLKNGGIIIWGDLKRGGSKALHAFDEVEVKRLFPGLELIYRKCISNNTVPKIANRFPELSIFMERIPLFKKVHDLIILKK